MDAEQTSMEATASTEATASPSAEQTQEAQPQQQNDWAKRFEALTRQERELQAQRSRFKDEQKRIAELEEENKRYRQLKETAAYDPTKLFEEYGWDMEKLSNHILNSSNGLSPREKHELLSEVKDVKKEIEELRQAREEERKRTVYNGFMSKIQTFVDSKPDDFELIRANNSYDLIYDVIDQHYSKNQRVLPYEDAAKLVEQHLESLLEPVIKLKKVKSKFGSLPKESETNEEDFEELQQTQQSQQSYRPTTLNNNFASTSNSNRPLTREEKLERAAKLIKWND